MKEEICVQCNQVIPKGACQQGQLIDDEWYPLHIGCAETWCQEGIEVWTIKAHDYGYTGDIECVKSELENLDFGEEITFQKRTIPRIEFLMMPEANI
jgi:hypothetical protein